MPSADSSLSQWRSPQSPGHSGKFIVIEGGEGSGKTTQLRRLHDWLRNHPELGLGGIGGGDASLLLTREPGGTTVGQSIRSLLLTPEPSTMIQDTTELLLYAADRAQHVQACIQPALVQGKIVLCDRYTDSTVAYQGYGRGLDLALIDQLNAIATGGLESDLTLWLDVEPALGLQRTKDRGVLDRLEQASLEFHQRVRVGFQRLAHQYPGRIVRIEASLPEDQVAHQIQAVVLERLRQWYPQPLTP